MTLVYVCFAGYFGCSFSFHFATLSNKLLFYLWGRICCGVSVLSYRSGWLLSYPFDMQFFCYGWLSTVKIFLLVELFITFGRGYCSESRTSLFFLYRLCVLGKCVLISMAFSAMGAISGSFHDWSTYWKLPFQVQEVLITIFNNQANSVVWDMWGHCHYFLSYWDPCSTTLTVLRYTVLTSPILCCPGKDSSYLPGSKKSCQLLNLVVVLLMVIKVLRCVLYLFIVLLQLISGQD